MHKFHLNHGLSYLNYIFFNVKNGLCEQRLILRLLVIASIGAQSDINQLIFPGKSINKKSIGGCFRFPSFVGMNEAKSIFSS